MKKLNGLLAISALSLAITGCGGEKNKINEQPQIKPQETTNVGCTVEGDANCFPFVLEYPVAGLQYTCSSDTINVFATKLNGNIVTGGCDKTNTVNFFLNVGNNKRVELGTLSLASLGKTSTSANPVHLTLLDMAQGLSGSAAQSLTTSDPTVHVAMALVKIFQAVGSQKGTETHLVGDVQPIELKDALLEGLDTVDSQINYQSYADNSYQTSLKPWVDTTLISDDQAFAVLKKLINVTFGSVYQADLPVTTLKINGLAGTTATENNQKSLLGSFFLISDRQGFTHGYGVQWRGVPESSSSSNETALINLVTQTSPVIMYANAQSDFISPISKRIGSVQPFAFNTEDNYSLTLNQGKLINDYLFAGSESFYTAMTESSTIVADELSKWTMSAGSEHYSGHADFFKVYPISYLDNRVFSTYDNVKSGKKYLFPLYATLTFNFDKVDGASQLAPIKLGIVIDENGDIRTDIRKDATSTDMSGQCGVADASAAAPVDNYAVQQYRIGTIGATSYSPNATPPDQSLTMRLILSGSHFGNLNGILLGVDTSVIEVDGSSTTTTSTASSVVKLNLHNLITATGTNTGTINISSPATNSNVTWINFYNNYKLTYLQAQRDSKAEATTEEKTVRMLSTGPASIALADCYQVNYK